MKMIVHNTTIITPREGTVAILPQHSFVSEHGRITELAPAASLNQRVSNNEFAEIIDGRGHLVIPGLVNTHHHLCQSLTRCLPAAQNDHLFDWLLKLYERWRHLDYQAVNIAAKVSLAELLLHGCTTTNDHFYMVPRDSNVRIEAVLDAAAELGIRIHACRGSMSLGRSHGGLPPDDCVERDADVLADCRRVIDRYHDPADYSLRRIDLAPCSPFNVTPELLRETRSLARERGVLLHTHLAETLEEEAFCLERFGCRPVQYLADLDWLGPDVYLAHCVYVNDEEVRLLAETHTGVSHCPTSNMRLGSGIAPLRKLVEAGVRVGLGVDGSSSNDAGNLLAEAKQAVLAARAWQALEKRGRQTATQPRSHKATDGSDQATKRSSDEGQEPRASAREDHRLSSAPENAGRASPRSPTRNPQPAIERGPLFPVAEAFKLITVGGAACLNRPELGHLNPGAAADFAMFRTDDPALAGAVAHDPVAAIILCDAPRADRVYVAGREVVHEGRVTALDQHVLGRQMNDLVTRRFQAADM